MPCKTAQNGAFYVDQIFNRPVKHLTMKRFLKLLTTFLFLGIITEGLVAQHAVTDDHRPEIIPVIGAHISGSFDRSELKLESSEILIAPIGYNSTISSQETQTVTAGFSTLDTEQALQPGELPTKALTNLRLFPVPVVNELNLEIDVQADMNIQLFDVLGRLIAQENLSLVRVHTLDFSQLDNGIYIIRVSVGDEVSTRKLEVYR